MVKTKRIYDTPAKEDGIRILVMRTWPRGIKKTSIDEWHKELGTELDLIKKWKTGKIEWGEFKQQYLAYIRKKEFEPLLKDIAHRAQKSTVTLLCSCEDESRCHRTLLKKEIEKYL